MRKLITGFTTAALLACGSVAQAAPVANDVRGSSPVAEAENMGGGSAMIAGIVGLLVLIYILTEIDGGDTETLPISR